VKPTIVPGFLFSIVYFLSAKQQKEGCMWESLKQIDVGKPMRLRSITAISACLSISGGTQHIIHSLLLDQGNNMKPSRLVSTPCFHYNDVYCVVWNVSLILEC
jgi:hypothetical protein